MKRERTIGGKEVRLGKIARFVQFPLVQQIVSERENQRISMRIDLGLELL